MPKEIQALASDRHVNVEGLNRLLRSLLYAVFIVSLLLWDKAMGAMLGYIKYYFSYMMVISVLQ
jgi:hypothetical protein